MIDKVKRTLDETCDLDKKQISSELVETLINRVEPNEDGTFKWYLKAENDDEISEFNEEEYVLYDEFILGYEEAKEYRKSFGNFLRVSQWKDLKVKVFIKYHK